MIKPRGEELRGALLVIAAGMCWGTTGTIQALAPEKATSLTVGSARVFVAGLILLCWILFRRRGILTGGRWNFLGIFIAAFGLTAYQLTFISAVRLTGVAIGTMIAIGSAPVLAGLMGKLFFKESLSAKWYYSTILAVTGCSLLAAAGREGFGFVCLQGVLLALAAAFSYALEGVGLKIIGKMDPMETISLISILSGAMALPWLVTGEVSWIAEPRGFAAVAMLALFSTILPFALFTKGIGSITLGKAYTLSLSEPFTAWLLSTAILGERLSITGSIGVFILFCGIAMLACEAQK